MRDWREGISLARITWQDEQGAEHLCVATERAWALEQLAVIEREPGHRLVSCVVERRQPGRCLVSGQRMYGSRCDRSQESRCLSELAPSGERCHQPSASSAIFTSGQAKSRR